MHFRVLQLALQIRLTSISLKVEVEVFAGSTMDQLPATAQRLQEIVEAQRNDVVCMQVRGYCQEGWPEYMPHQPLLRPYWESRAHLAVVDDLLLYDERIVIPQDWTYWTASIAATLALANAVRELECQFGGLGYL